MKETCRRARFDKDGIEQVYWSKGIKRSGNADFFFPHKDRVSHSVVLTGLKFTVCCRMAFFLLETVFLSQLPKFWDLRNVH